MKTKSLFLATVLAAFVVPAFAQDNTIHVRLINAVPNSQAMSVSIGNNAVVQNVKPHDISAYTPMPEMDDDQRVTLQNGSQQLQTKDKLSFDDANENYTILVSPEKDDPNPKVKVLKLKRKDVASDKVQIQMINAAPEHKSLKLKLNNDTEERGVDYADSGHTTVKPGVYNLQVVDASGSDTVIATRSVTLTGGTAITVLVTSPNNVKIVNDQAPHQDMSASQGSSVGHVTTGSATRAPATMTTPAMSM